MLILRDYQVDAVEKIRDRFRQGHRLIMLYLPTGGGKTECAISILDATAKKYKRSAMIMDRVILCTQTSQRLEKYKIDHGVLQSGSPRYRPAEKIQICTSQTLLKRGFPEDLSLLVIDEAHVVTEHTKKYMAANPSLYVIGLSASPFKAGLGDIFTGGVVSATTTKELVDNGSLCPMRVFISKEINTDGLKKVAGEWKEYDVGERAKVLSGDIVATWEEKTHSIFGKPEKTIVFCSGVAHGDHLAREFAAKGYNFVPLSYQDDSEFKADIIADFERDDSTIHGLIATDILTKGFDNGKVKIGVSARPFSKSFSSHVQQLGRIMRTADGKDFGVWICHSGNFLGFQDEWDELYSCGLDELVAGGREKERKKKTKEQKEAKKCPRCGSLWPAYSLICSHCGMERIKPNTVENVAGVVEELDENHKSKSKATMQEKQDFYSQLLGYSRSKGFKDGWAANKYREKFGVWPKGIKDATAPLGEDVKGFITHSYIKFSKGKK